MNNGVYEAGFARSQCAYELAIRELFETPGFAETTNVEHIKVHCYWSQDSVNPSRIVPVGPQMDLLASHGRDRPGAPA